MKREFLKSLELSDSAIDKIMAEYGKSVTDLKAQVLDLEGQVKAQTKQLSDRDSELESLRKSVSDSQALQEQINKLTDEAKSSKEAYESEIHSVRVDKAKTIALMNAGAKNIKAVSALLSLDKAELDGESIKGLDKQIEGLKQSDPYLFSTDVTPSLSGTKPGEGTGKPATSAPKTYADFVRMQEAGQ